MSESRYPPAVIEPALADRLNAAGISRSWLLAHLPDAKEKGSVCDQAISDAFADWYKDRFGISAPPSYWTSRLYLAFKAGVAFAEGKR